MRWWRWLGPAAVLGIAAALRFWALSRPDSLVFDELYYVRDAISQLARGFPTVWPDDDPDMSGARATGFTDAPSNAVHPPLGKWLIGLGILVFGPGSGWGWRSAVAVAGVATVAVVMRLGWRISRSLLVACTAGLLLAIDGVHVVLSRVGLLDGILTLFVALGALFVWRDQEAVSLRSDALVRSEVSGRTPPAGAGSATGRRAIAPDVVWRRPWLLAAGLTFGAAAAVKWSGLYALAFFLVYVTVRDLLARLRAGGERRSAVAGSALQALVSAAIALPAAAVVYISSWAGWILNPGGWGRTPGTPWPVSLARYHAEMLGWHSTLSAPHPYQSPPLTWPLALIPTAMYKARWTDGCPQGACVAAISPLPNPLVTWGGVAALLVIAYLIVRRSTRGRGSAAPDPLVAAGAFVLTGYLSGWLPWVFTFSRSAVFQFYAVVLTPFSALALALLLGLLTGIPLRSGAGAAAGLRLDSSPEALRGRRIAVALFITAAMALAVLFFPVWSGMPVAEWFWKWHLWLPGWG
ncbi:dolichyl-phosphate-mannose--protein mannosyltransferase [Leucobacter sp. wl10]|uniref:dolichyl-phosphate-mannose--protein mannosyltransferase n=1 Tax=Leucobacter sp. wl10 TaxID=2304677 RepID=UPI001F092BE9|nr:phospholipid carrier-dependent glycosyltransferase [Leucobacter sp. wl10]